MRNKGKIMNEILIRGYSDDLINIEGDLNLEFYARYEAWNYLHFDNGLIVKIGYDMEEDKGWSISVYNPRVDIPDCIVEVDNPEVDDNSEHYSDRVRVKGNFSSIECWGSPEGPDTTDVIEFWERVDVFDYDDEALLAAMKLLKKSKN
jgi:hypothetical protein